MARGSETRESLYAWGWRDHNAFMSVSTPMLPVSPQVKPADRGPVRVVAREWEPAVVDDGRP